jgi:hypothetical protein
MRLIVEARFQHKRRRRNRSVTLMRYSQIMRTISESLGGKRPSEAF